MNPEFNSSERRIDPLLPGAWRTKPSAPRAETTDYYATAESSYGFRSGRPEYDGYKAEPDAFVDRSFDRYNGNQPVFPSMEERQVMAGGEGGSRKRMNDTPGFHQAKRPYESRNVSAPVVPNYRFAGDSSDILQEEARKCIAEMSQELAILESQQNPDYQFLAHTRRLLNEEIHKITNSSNPEWLDVESTKSSVKVSKRVLLPRSRPGSNVVGRLMGVKGSTLRKMCQTYKCHISICGAGSKKNPKEEAELLRSGDPRHSHLACPLHAEVSTTGPPHLAYTRLGQILTLLHKIITVEDRFEHDGLVFETSNVEEYHQRRRDESSGDQSYSKDNGSSEFRTEERQSYRGNRSHRGRGPQRDSYRSGSPRQQRNTSWRNNDAQPETEGETTQEEAPKPVEGSSSRGRGRGGFVPRGGRGRFVPRRSDQ